MPLRWPGEWDTDKLKTAQNLQDESPMKTFSVLTSGCTSGALPAMKMRAWIFAVIGLLFTLVTARAELRLHGLFTDNLVLQRDEPVYIWGWCDNDDTVTVSFRNTQTKAKVKVQVKAKKEKTLPLLKGQRQLTAFFR